MGGAGIGGQHQAGFLDECQQLLEVGLPHQIHWLALAQALDVGSQIPLQPGRPAAEIDLKPLAGGVIRQGGIAFGGPVLERLAGGGADEQGRLAVYLLPGPGLVLGADGQLPVRGQILDAELPGEGEKAIQHMGGGGGRHLMVGEQPLAVVGPRLVEPEFDLCSDAQGGDAGTQGSLQVEQGIEFAPLEGAPEITVATPALALVEGDHLDPGQIGKQGRLYLAGNPGDASLWPGPLDDAHQRQRMAAIPDGGEPQDADRGGRRLEQRHDVAQWWQNGWMALCKLPCGL
ncbi:hypothetical protein D3C84_492590 [compost metagenome]